MDDVKFDEILEKRRVAKALYDKSEKGKEAHRRAYERRKQKLLEMEEPRTTPSRTSEKKFMAGVWYEDNPRLVKPW